MIKTFFCNEDEKIYPEVNKYVNKNLKKMVGGSIDIYNDSEGTIKIFPAYMYEENNEFDRRTLYELLNLINSKIERRVIKPKYEYALFYIIQYWLDLDGSDFEYRFEEVDKSLKYGIDKIDKEYNEDDEHVSLLESITKLRNYEDHCFWDWDFLPENIDMYTNWYIDNLENEKYREEYEWLDEYEPLMSPDLKENYLKVRKRGKKLAINILSDGMDKVMGNIYINNGNANVMGENSNISNSNFNLTREDSNDNLDKIIKFIYEIEKSKDICKEDKNECINSLNSLVIGKQNKNEEEVNSAKVRWKRILNKVGVNTLSALAITSDIITVGTPLFTMLFM